MLCFDFRHLLEKVFKASWKQASQILRAFCALDRECLSTSSLSVGENTSIKTLQTLVDYAAANILEKGFLWRFLPCNVVEREFVRHRFQSEGLLVYNFFDAAGFVERTFRWLFAHRIITFMNQKGGRLQLAW